MPPPCSAVVAVVANKLLALAIPIVNLRLCRGRPVALASARSIEELLLLRESLLLLAWCFCLICAPLLFSSLCCLVLLYYPAYFFGTFCCCYALCLGRIDFAKCLCGPLGFQ